MPGGLNEGSSFSVCGVRILGFATLCFLFFDSECLMVLRACRLQATVACNIVAGFKA